ncbi:ACP phosphodiesterase [Flavobacterium crassostreae]|uniref:ACP phosphodiesterase n=1 Tax=Flavobacterium crassostreae TaxID=1763534 RepID=A0A1B9EAA5_9FLAO|nr:ACP phosphodiesterase [Flavobacterium crassostreae]OCB78872.1 ACP phosphodiesterase [Flavobacterium crassostreae]
MNFLAHIYLSGNNAHIQIGNFMADGIRGKHLDHFPSDIQRGIILHRAIDTYTDAHPVFRKSTKKLHANYHHYAGVIVDIFYDHFLAKNWSAYSDENLEEYIASFYDSLKENESHLTPKTLGLMPYMVQQNWLSSYQTIAGIKGILTQMDRRTQNASRMRFATQELVLHYTEFEQEFTAFFEDLKQHAQAHLAANF